MINQVRDMADSLIFPVAGFIIVFLLSMIGWGARQYFSEFQTAINKIIVKLDGIEAQISELKTENQLQSAYIREIEKWVKDQVDRLDKRIEVKRDKIHGNTVKISDVERKIDKILTLHGQNHPNDKL